MKIKELEPAIFRLKQHASCRELKARKLLGRVREANVQQAAGASVPAVLLRRIWQHPLVRGSKNFVSLLDIEHWADQEIKTLVKQDRLEKLQEWRRKMRNNMTHAREWVKRGIIISQSLRCSLKDTRTIQPLLRISNLLKLFRSFGRLSGKETGHPCRKLFSFGRKAVSPCRNMPGQTSHLRNFTDKQSE